VANGQLLSTALPYTQRPRRRDRFRASCLGFQEALLPAPRDGRQQHRSQQPRQTDGQTDRHTQGHRHHRHQLIVVADGPERRNRAARPGARWLAATRP